MSVVGRAHEDDEAAPEHKPGLVAELKSAELPPSSQIDERIDETIAFAWLKRAPDPRLEGDDYQVTWRGRVMLPAPGTYQFHLHCAGAARLTLGGKSLIDALQDTATTGPRWLDSARIDLSFGYHALEVEFRRTSPQASIALFWSGPQFGIEPIGASLLFHDPNAGADGLFESGRQLSRALRCGACHAILGEPPPLAAPSLRRLAGNVSPDWLVDWIARPHSFDPKNPPSANKPPSHRRMPDFGLSRDDANAVAAWLISQSEPAPKLADEPPRDGSAGRELFLSVGCLACHQLDALGSNALFSGGDLSHVADKRPADFFARWLADPASINRSHLMPVFPLDERERADMAAYLRRLHAPNQATEDAATDTNTSAPKTTPSWLDPPAPQAIALGRRLAARHGCAACHEMPADPLLAPNVRPRLARKLNWKKSCLVVEDSDSPQPRFTLSAADRAAVRRYFTSMHRGAPAQKPATKPASAPKVDAPSAVFDGHILEERNCLACHARDLKPGIAGTVAALAAAHPEWAPRIPALIPPSLSGVGDKLLDEALHAAITVREPPRRPWLAVRMPKFGLSSAELSSLVTHLITKDRIPARNDQAQLAIDTAALHSVASRLVTAEGFGCTSCHAIGSSIPQQVELAAHGSDLIGLGGRIRPAWFDRWVRNPARIMPRMEMPAIQQPVRGVLKDNLDAQLAAIWQVLNEPGFNPPQPNPVRILRTRNVGGETEPAVGLCDLLESGGRVLVQPLVIGLPNRHNLLFDREHGSLAAWWIGDTARQRTRGKGWYWEPGGVDVLPQVTTEAKAEFELLLDRQVCQGVPFNQVIAELDGWAHVSGGLRFDYRLQFANPNAGSAPVAVHVRQSVSALNANGDEPEKAASSGFRRRIEISGLPPNAALRLRAAPWPGLHLTSPHAQVVQSDAPGRPIVRLVSPQGQEFEPIDASVAVVLEASDEGKAACELEYLAALPLDSFPIDPPPFEPLPPVPLDVVPGFKADRLPLDISEMPTALAWRTDGTLVFTSLKGGLFLARDTDGDGLEDSQVLFQDGLSAPYGVAASGEAIDVIHKQGLWRLWDRDGDDHADEMYVAASGWGCTADYHDWAVGLPRDAAGNYYMALPCQQDERTNSAARLRGTAIRLAAREPTMDDPRLFAVHELCAGLRFPMGLALNERGDLFATDNQGNYNPFNELNHLVPGVRYGFINRLEQRTDFQPPFLPPAIEIPHPWTRSINGICFLITPPAVKDAADGDGFGPFEGDLLGCEYDTRRLIRMTLDRVGDVYQGAAYPFSVEPAQGAETFEGPVVCQVSPEGDVYVGNLRDSGWGGGQNTGSLVRLRPVGNLPAGIAEVHAVPGGFQVVFTRPVDPARANESDNYGISSYRRIATADYGGPDVDRGEHAVASVIVADDARSVSLQVDGLREGFVYELHLKNLGAESGPFFPAEAYYTMRRLPDAATR